MKRVLVTLFVLALVAAPVLGQDAFEQGSWMLGGSAGYSARSGDLYENGDGDGQSNMWLNPDLGYFVIDNLALGLELNITSWSQGDATDSFMGVGPMVMYTFPMGQGAPFVAASFAYGKSTWNSGAEGADDWKYTRTSLNLTGGYIHMLSDYVGLFGALRYTMDSRTQDEPEVPDGVEDSFSGTQISALIGFQIFHH